MTTQTQTTATPTSTMRGSRRWSSKADPRQEHQVASTRRIALITGLLLLITFVSAIAAVILYAPVLHPANYIVGAGADTRVRLGAFCELILIIANIGTAVVLFPILKRQNESLALGLRYSSYR
jgi:hypothetical protein